MTLAEVVASPAGLASRRAAWDALAVAQGLPLARPDWLLGWWEAQDPVAPRRLHVAVASDGDGVAGLAPLFVEDPASPVLRMRLLGRTTLFGTAPVLRAEGAERTIAALGRAVADTGGRPTIVTLDAVAAGAAWLPALARALGPLGASIHPLRSGQSVGIRLEGTFEQWLRARAKGWRGSYRTRARRFREHGGELRRVADVQDLLPAMRALSALHHRRWEHRSDWLTPDVERLLASAAPSMLPSGGFRLWTAVVGERVVGATAFAAAGGGVAMLLTGFDPEWRRFGLGIATVAAAVEEAFALGDAYVDFGHGGFPYTAAMANDVRPVTWCDLIMANDVRPVTWCDLIVRNRGYAVACARALPRHARQAVIEARVRWRVGTRAAAARRRLGLRAADSRRRMVQAVDVGRRR
jgi:CelD/BcsL family acetyltransferase involved in cellulose biosynthesis